MRRGHDGGLVPKPIVDPVEFLWALYPLIRFSAPGQSCFRDGYLRALVPAEFVNDSYHPYVFSNPLSSSYNLNAKIIASLFTGLGLQLFHFHMFHSALRPFSFLHHTRGTLTTQYFHQVTTDFITYDVKGSLVTRKVPIIIGNPGETYVLVDPGVGHALCAASPLTSASTAHAEDRCKLTFFHDSQHFGFGELSVCECLCSWCSQFTLNVRKVKLSPPLCPKPNPLPNRVKHKPCNFILEWEDA